MLDPDLHQNDHENLPKLNPDQMQFGTEAVKKALKHYKLLHKQIESHFAIRSRSGSFTYSPFHEIAKALASTGTGLSLT